MSKKAKAETQPAKDETPQPVAPETSDGHVKPGFTFGVGQIVKASKDGEFVFVGEVIYASEGRVSLCGSNERGQTFDVVDCQALTDDELTRYAIVTQQTTLGMGNIIDAVVNG